jgi:hypothetical protein
VSLLLTLPFVHNGFHPFLCNIGVIRATSNGCDLSTVILPDDGKHVLISKWEKASIIIETFMVHAKDQYWFILNVVLRNPEIPIFFQRPKAFLAIMG